jgi:hypothetical protein
VALAVPVVERPSSEATAPAAAPLIRVAAPSASAAAEAVAEETPASEAILKPSVAPALIKSSALVLKWSLFAAVLLGVAFLAIRFLVPFLNELRNPKPPAAPIDKEASVAVKVLQQTRQVVAKSDAKVNYLNEVIDTGDGKSAEKKNVPPPPPRVEPPRFVPGPAAAPDLSAFRDAVAAMKVDSVVLGSPSRAFIDGRFVKQGDIVHRGLGLRFTGVDPDEHAIWFTNADNVVFKKHY